MSVLIKGLKLPKDCAVKAAIRDGIASVYLDDNKADYYTAVELPDHGDLIDRDVVADALDAMTSYHKLGNAYDWVTYDCPSVIPAEKSEASLCDNCDEKNDVGCCWCKKMERSDE